MTSENGPENQLKDAHELTENYNQDTVNNLSKVNERSPKTIINPTAISNNENSKNELNSDATVNEEMSKSLDLGGSFVNKIEQEANQTSERKNIKLLQKQIDDKNMPRLNDYNSSFKSELVLNRIVPNKSSLKQKTKSDSNLYDSQKFSKEKQIQFIVPILHDENYDEKLIMDEKNLKDELDDESYWISSGKTKFGLQLDR